jgi:hypothetical protein
MNPFLEQYDFFDTSTKNIIKLALANTLIKSQTETIDIIDTLNT